MPRRKAKKNTPTAKGQKTFKAVTGTLSFYGKKIAKKTGQVFFKVSIDLEEAIKFKGQSTNRVDGIIYDQRIAGKLYGLTYHPTKKWIKTGQRAQTGCLVTLNGEYSQEINTYEGEKFLNVEIIVRKFDNLTIEVLDDIPDDLLGYASTDDADDPLPV